MGWTVRDIPDLKGRSVVVTGANSGLGHVTARELARRGAHTVLACRDRERGQAALDRLRDEVPEARLELRLLDLAELSSVRAFAAQWRGERLDLLINNAGLMAVPHGRTSDGFETHFGVNHLGHFALTGLLLPALLAAPSPRVVTVSSFLHLMANVDLSRPAPGEDPGTGVGRRHNRWVAYARSKSANLLFTHELARRAAGSGLVAVAAHPGWAATELQTKGPRLAGSAVRERGMRVLNGLFAARPEAGAVPLLYAATASGLPPDAYAGPRTPGRPGGGRAWRAPWTRDDAMSARLWEVSERLTRVHYDFTGAAS
ncbi:oxidoreductase [Streptomyces sp. RFCAC02]|uniref:oxidoreductase n=1 Tax=Streptomyces sp. RFCAC02 TaxID=2499143 RepID=UPI00101F18CB|nr:oxidoreductase [Streptomyces sp. RFCAC02]